MHWFFLALIGPILYACANHTDKYIISKYLKNEEVGALIIFSSIFSIIALPIVLYIHPSVFNVGFLHGIILGINSMLVVIAVLLYLYALQRDEASYVVPFYQTIPIFAFILGYFVLGESVNIFQGLASLIIILGTLVLSVDWGLGKITFKKHVVLLMLGASLLYAINGIVFKLIAVNEGFWPSTFWGLIGKIILGFIFLIFIPHYRLQFLETMKEGGSPVFFLNSLSESLFIVGEAVTQYSTLLAPVALVLLVNSLQPLFVFIFGVVLALFSRSVGQESLDQSAVRQKVIGVGLIILGSYFLGK
jgi:drug/metabolite transporter (DMT)-like permease